jgi:hypothetical protein
VTAVRGALGVAAGAADRLTGAGRCASGTTGEAGGPVGDGRAAGGSLAARMLVAAAGGAAGAAAGGGGASAARCFVSVVLGASALRDGATAAPTDAGAMALEAGLVTAAGRWSGRGSAPGKTIQTSSAVLSAITTPSAHGQ